MDSPLDIYLTRYSDTLISLSDRSKLAKALKADLFVSLHCNHSDNPNARGVEIYVANVTSENLYNSTWLGYQFQVSFKKKLGFESRGVRFADFQVLREMIGYCLAILLEMGFLSNRDECEYYLKSESYQVLGLVILDSLIKNIDNYERVGD